MMAGVSMAHAPYRSTALAVADLLSGKVQVMFENVVASMEYITGKLGPLAVTTTTPLCALAGYFCRGRCPTGL
jgi:tripartite-type tricarboxylate transporter receptor subunit TctC